MTFPLQGVYKGDGHGAKIMTPRQITAARALLGWTQKDLAHYADVSSATIKNAENEETRVAERSLHKIEAALEKENIEFLGKDGVRISPKSVQTHVGRAGFLDFMNDVYETAKESGGEICVFNVDERNWIRLMGQETYEKHSQRMQTLKHMINFKIIVKEGDRFFIASDFAEYRWFPENLFNEHSFYAYGDKLALITFAKDEKDVRVIILSQAEITTGFRVLFDISWSQVAQVPKN